MQKYLLLACCLVLQFNLFSQNTSTYLHAHAQCGTEDPTPAEIKHTLEVIDQMDAQRNAVGTQIPFRVNIVTQNDGSGGISLDEVNKAIAQINYVYYPMGIEFYICAINYINDNAFYDMDKADASTQCPPYEVNDAFNLFLVNSLVSSGNSICGFASYPYNNITSLRIVIKNSCLASNENGTFAHELGHSFNLYHTQRGTENGNTDPNAEHVPRSGANSNCGTQGDLLCDTAADPKGTLSGCTYTGTGTDVFGNAYTPPIDNIMSYYNDACGGIFTPDQYTRMSNALAARLGHSTYNLTGCSPNVVTDPSGCTATLNNSYGIDISWTDGASNETGYLIERSIDGGTTWIPISGAGVGPNITSYTDADLTANTTYVYRIKASNDDPDHYCTTAPITTGLLYCTPTYQSNSCSQGGGVGIEIFSLTGGTPAINNTSGCSALSIYSASVPASNVSAGSTYNWTVDLLNSSTGSFYRQNATIWIDLNQDGDFTDPGEMLAQTAFTGSSGGAFSGTITIPSCAMNGITTLRVRTRFSTNGTVDDPCIYYSFGETEDYAVNISGGTMPSATINISESSGSTNDDGDICAGDTATLTASGGGTYAWSNGSTSAAITVSNAGTYDVTVTAGVGCSNTSSATVGLASAPAASISVIENSGATSNDGIICSGDSATLTASGGGTYLWSDGSTSSSINITSAGTCSVTVTGTNGCMAIASQVITTTTPPTAELSGTTSFCPGMGQTADLSLTLTGNGPWEVTYDLNGTSIVSTYSSPSSIITISEGDMISLLNVQTDGCDGTVITNINNIPITTPTADLTGATSFCQGAGGTADLTLTLTGNGPWDVTFDINGTTFVSTYSSPNAIVTINEGDIISLVNVQTNGCDGTVTTNVNNFPITPPTADLSGHFAYCPGGGDTADLALTLTGTGPWDVTYEINGASTTITYGSSNQIITINEFQNISLISVVSSGCQGTVTNNITTSIITPPIADLSGTFNYCPGAGDFADLVLTLSGSGPWDVTYDINGTVVAQSFSNNNATITITEGDVIQLLSVVQNGCPGSVSTNVSINPYTLPSAIISVNENSGNTPNDGFLCMGDAATLTASGGNSYIWSDGSTNASLTATGSGTYAVTVIDSNGCTNSAVQSITVNNLPFVSLALSFPPICDGDGPIPGISGAVTPSGGVYSGTGVTDDGNGTSFTFDPAITGPGFHSVAYTFTDSNGCSGMDVSTIEVESSIPPSGPGTITGTSKVCYGTNGINYAVLAEPGVDSYIWAYSGSNVNINNQGSNNITLDFAPNATSGILTVTAYTSCASNNSSYSIEFVPDFLHIDTPYLNADPSETIYQAKVITSDAVVPITRDVTYQYEVCTELQIGFETILGAEFEVIYVPCSNVLLRVDEGEATPMLELNQH